MDEIFRDFLVTFIIVAALFGIVYVYYLTRHRERVIMMERGLDLADLSSGKRSKWNALKFGILLAGLAIGILVGNILHEYFGLSDKVSFLSMILMFGGLGLIIYFLIETKYKK